MNDQSDRRRVPTEQYRAIMEALPIAVSLTKTVRDNDSNIVDFTLEYVNRAAEAIIGVPRSELIGQRLRALVPNLDETGLFDKYCAVVTTGEPLVLGPYPFEGSVAGKDISGFFDIHLTRYDDGFISVSLDVTEKIKTQEALVAAEASAMRRRESEEQAKELSGTVLHWLAEASHALESNESARARNAMSEALKAGSRILTDLRKHS